MARHIWFMSLGTDTDLTARMLIAMPGMGDPRFAQAVVFICAHSEDGAMGLIVNKPATELRFTDLLEQLDITPGDGARDIRVHFGGPVEHGRGFVLHSGEYRAESDSTLGINDEFALTATLDILEDLAQGQGPARSLLALGYAGWAAGQLESEIAENGWLMAEARADIVFGQDNTEKWRRALETIGVDPVMLSATGGRA